MFNPNLILNAASEVNLTIKTNGELNKIIKKIDLFKPNNNEDILSLNENETDLFKTIQLDLNNLKKTQLKIKILRSGIKISNVKDLNQLKKLKIENLLNIDPSITSQVHNILLMINSKQDLLKNLNDKDENMIVEDYNLMPQTSLIILMMFIILIISIVTLYITFSYIFLYVKYSFLNETLAFWIMLLGGLIFIVSINSLLKNIFVKIQEIKNKQKIRYELAIQFLNKTERKINKTVLRLSKKQFEIERKSIKEASILKLKELLIEETSLIKTLKANFN